jgi:hypothetical protein
MNKTTLTPARKFTWNNTIGTAFASDLGYTCGVTPGYAIFERMRLGFKVQGKKDTKIFLLKQTTKDRKGDVTGWLYESEDYDYSIFIYND